jgi:hypothetical protein
MQESRKQNPRNVATLLDTLESLAESEEAAEQLMKSGLPDKICSAY